MDPVSPRRRGRPPLPLEERKPRKGGKARTPTAAEVAAYVALARRLYPEAQWPTLPVGAGAEIARRIGVHGDTIRSALRGKRALGADVLAKWSDAFPPP